MTHPYLELRDVDRKFWAERINPSLPPAIFDAHRHIAAPEDLEPFTLERRKSNWDFEVGVQESLEEVQVGYSQVFPGRSVSFLAFGPPFRECHLEQNNAYRSNGLRGTDSAALALTSPEWSAEKVAEWLRQPRIIGIKPYYDLVPGCKGDDVSIFDLCPHEHLEALDEVGGWLTLHLPRKERLADPDNLAEIREIRQRYSRIVFVIAHLGRCYSGRYARVGLPAICSEEGILFDTSAVFNPAVFAVALDRVGPERLLFGSDFPIFYVRGRQKWDGDIYTNLTERDYGGNVDRDPPEVVANYTLFIYEAIAACIDMCRGLGFDQKALSAIFHDNARRLVDRLLIEKENW